MNIKKQFLVLTLIMFVSVVFISNTCCGKGEERKANQTLNNEEVKMIKIGALLPLTGAGAFFAEYIKAGLEYAKDEFNAKSNVKIEILYEDTKNQPKVAIQGYNKLVQVDKTPVVIVAQSGVAKALAPLSKTTKTVQIGIAVAIPGITDESEYVFRIYPEAHGMAGVMSTFAAKELKMKTAGVIYINDDFGQSSYDVFKKVFEENGGKVIFAESYEFTQQSYRDQILKLKKENPGCIYMNGYGLAYGLIIKQLKELEVESVITADMTLGIPVTLKQAGDAAEGAYFVDGKMSEEFINNYKNKFNKAPTSYAGYAFDILNILGSIITQQMPDQINSDAIRDRLFEIQDFPGVMGKIKILPNGESNIQFVVKKIQNGIPQVIK